MSQTHQDTPNTESSSANLLMDTTNQTEDSKKRQRTNVDVNSPSEEPLLADPVLDDYRLH
jgi:hypothetical protein